MNERTTGGKEDNDNVINVVISNQDWLSLENVLNKEELIIAEKFIGVEITLKDIININGIKKTYNLINDILLILSKVFYSKRKEYNLTFNEICILLDRLIKENGIYKTAKETNINPKTLNKILNNSLDYNIKFIKTLCEFFDIKF